MKEQPSQSSRRVTREELYALVWQTPMSHLANEFGVSDRGLAKVCDSLNVPYPPRGYWAKKEAGRPVEAVKLPTKTGRSREWVDIHRTLPRPKSALQAIAALEAATVAATGITVPETIENLHPKVNAWVAQHKQDQREREQKHRMRKHGSWYWGKPLLDDLTERDLYRFRVTSTIFKAVESAGGQVENASINGKVTFLVRRHKVECSIVEKMFRPLKPPAGEAAKWTAYPEHHQTGLHSTGFLRVTITTYLRRKDPQWIETKKEKIADWLPEIVGTIIAAGPILDKMERERQEQELRYRENEARRLEMQRQREIDERRWAAFRKCAGNWEERAKLIAFLREIQRRFEIEGESQVGDLPLSEWISWAQRRIDALDPFNQSLCGLFGSISR